VAADPETQVFASDDELKKQFDACGATDKDEVICYCGGGIAACNTALALTRLGVDNVSVYDGSMTEWAADPSLPLEVD
jgi:thiosulfate/3-mercaptopyruvate sulfurtransferase